MKKQLKTKASARVPVKTMTAMVILLFIIGMANSGFKNQPADPTAEGPKKDSIASVEAFMRVYTVLTSPRCMNCHPSGDVPLQGDDSHLHTMYPNRGKDGKGLYAMKCANCHQPANTAGLHTPPGNPNWHLPPADMKMIFQGRTPHELARQLVDPNQNGHRTRAQLLEHASDGLVMSAWQPGEGRSLPPMGYEAFAKDWATWLKKGAYAPK
jgi:hypothetical protein